MDGCPFHSIYSLLGLDSALGGVRIGDHVGISQHCIREMVMLLLNVVVIYCDDLLLLLNGNCASWLLYCS